MFTPIRWVSRPPGRTLAFVLILCMAGSVPSLRGAEPGQKSFALAAGDAAVTLETFSEQAGAQLVYLVEDVRGVATAALHGSFAPGEALRRLVAGTALVVVQEGKTGAFVISRDRGRASIQDPRPALPMNKKLPAWLAALLATTGSALAQAPAPAAPAASPRADDPTVILSPFTVSTSQDRGYAATNTLGGTRLNTALRDTAAAVSIVTPEFMRDLGVTNLQTLATFMTSAERDVQAYNSAMNNAGGTRIRGVFVGGNTSNFFGTPWRLDSYNLDRITQNRGPNSLLFGVGNPAGLITGTTRQALLTGARTRGSAEALFDSEGTVRGELDVNHIVKADRAALRISALDTREETFQKPSRWDERRLFLTGSARLLDRGAVRTTLRADGEWARADRILPEYRPPQDAITPWFNGGRPTLPGTAAGSNPGALPSTLVRAFGANTVVVVDGSPTAVPVLNWLNTVRGAEQVLPVTTERLRLTKSGPVPYTPNYNGPVRSSDYAGRMLSFFLEQQITRDLVFELAHSRNNLDRDWVRGEGGDNARLQVDANQLLPNGQPNPNVGRYYVEGNVRVSREFTKAEETRFTAAYSHDATRHHRWLGRHQVAGLLNRIEGRSGADDMREVNATPLPGFSARLDDVQNRIVRRTYLFNGSKVWLDGRTFGGLPPINSSGVRSELLPVASLSGSRSEIEGWTLGTQSKFFRDRLVLTYGHRHDNLVAFGLDPTRTGRDGRGLLPYWRQVPLVRTAAQRSDTQSKGVVVHALPQLSAFYNESETVDLASGQSDVRGNPLPVPQGTGRDYGLKFSLLGDRLVGTVAYFESGVLNQFSSLLQGAPVQGNLIARAIGRTDLLVLETGRDTLDTAIQGYELELTLNATENWRVAFNASKIENEQANVANRMAAYLQGTIFPLQASHPGVVLSNGRTVTQEIDIMRSDFERLKLAQEGRLARELREWNANLVTNYRFARGPLRGFSLGGWAQYRGQPVIGVRINPATGAIDASRRIKGNDFLLLGAHLGYERPLARNLRWSVRLGVSNLLDEDAFIQKEAEARFGAVTESAIQAPRLWTLSSRLTF